MALTQREFTDPFALTLYVRMAECLDVPVLADPPGMPYRAVIDTDHPRFGVLEEDFLEKVTLIPDAMSRILPLVVQQYREELGRRATTRSDTVPEDN